MRDGDQAMGGGRRRVARHARWAAAALVATASASAGAAAPSVVGNFREGLWEMTARAEVPGTRPVPPITLKKCITAAEIQELQARASQPPGSDKCKVLDQRTQGATTSWKLECSGRTKITGEGTVTFSGDTYALQSSMVVTGSDGKVVQVRNELNGRRVGDCKPGAQ